MGHDMSDGWPGGDPTGEPLGDPIGVERPTDEMHELFGLAFAGAERFAEMLVA